AAGARDGARWRRSVSSLSPSGGKMCFELGEPLARAHVLPHAAVQLSADEPPSRGRVQQGGERRLLLWRDAGDHPGRHHGDARVSVARLGAVADRSVLEREVAAGAVRRIRHQDEMRKARAERDAAQGGKIEFAVDVGVYQKKRRLAEERARLGDSARRFERLALAGVADAHAVALAVTEALDDALGEVPHLDDRL